MDEYNLDAAVMFRSNFLGSKVSERALEVWGSEEKLDEERDLREDKRQAAKQKKFDKKVKGLLVGHSVHFNDLLETLHSILKLWCDVIISELRKQVRSSLWRKDLSSHEHEFGEETYNEADDVYSKQCTTCGHVTTYEKM